MLVIPRKHIARLADAAPEDQELVGEVVARAAAIARDLGLEHYRLVANNGEGAGQTVFHLHFHLMGGQTDELASGLDASQSPLAFPVIPSGARDPF